MLTNQLLTALQPMVGFRDELYNSDDVDELLNETSTGLTVDQCHELITLDTLRATGRYSMDGKGFEDYLHRTREDAIRALLITLHTRLTEMGLTPRLLKPTVLFGGVATTTPIIIPTGNTVGFQFRCQQSDVTVVLDRLQFTGTYPPDFALTLVNEDTGVSKPIPITGNWQDVGIQLQAGFGYLLTYDQADLGQTYFARNTMTQWPKAKPGCRGCWAGCLNNYVAIDAIKVSSSGTDITKDTNYGINLVFSAEGDVSGRLVDNPARLLPVLKQQIAMTFLEKIAYSTRKNGATENAIQGALFALTDKDNANRVPLLLDRALSSLTKSLQTEASSALDVNQGDELTWGTI